MKLTLVVVACMALAGITAAYHHEHSKLDVNKTLLTQQKFLLEIVNHMDHLPQFEEWVKFGDKLACDKVHYTVFNEDMEKFTKAYETGAILGRGEFFSAIQKYHALQARGLFYMLYYAYDWEIFVTNAAWARMHVSEGMFVYALTLAVIHHPHMKKLILPPIYEILPEMFFNSKYIMEAEKFNFDAWNRQIMLEKELVPIYENKYASKIFKERFFMKDWKVWQWWKLMGLDEEFHFEEYTPLRNNIQLLKEDPKFKAVWTGVKKYWIPVDYTRDVEIFNDESALSYFTEDVGLNAYWYYLNMYYPSILLGTEFHLDVDRRGEWWIYNVQQLLARYYAERLSAEMGFMDDLSFYGTVKEGYDPQLIAYNGNGFSFRENYYDMKTYGNVRVFNKFAAISRRMDDVLDSGKYVTKDGKVIDFTKPESVEMIGDMLQGNIDIIDKKFFGYWYPFACLYFSGGDFDSMTVVPHVLQNYETMLRDPITYLIFKKMLNFYYKFKGHLAPYKPEEVIMNTVKVYDAEVSPLKTYFDFVDFDVTTLLNEKMVFHEGQYVWDKTLLARQMRLNHVPFTYKLKVKSDVAQKAVVRAFIVPVFDEYGEHIDYSDYNQYFISLDKFVVDLTAGENLIERKSQDLPYTADDFTTYTELYKYVMLAYEGKEAFPVEIAQRHCQFPDRLVLPSGWVEGMPMKIIFFITPYTGKDVDAVTHDYYSCHVGAGDRYVDELPFGYPFDREITNYLEFFGPNSLVKDVKIYHIEKYQKYYPKKYEHFGTFDYTYNQSF